MKVLCLWRVKDGADMSKVSELLLKEELFAWDLVGKDILREHYESDMPTPAISVLEIESVQAARELLKDLPINKAGYLEPTYLPLRPFMNWEVLFKDEFKTR
ncbi:MAG: superoxide dismutase [Myxococcota bacterium]